nr:hypothetical protein [Tanacetum cinerariifolium]
MTAVSCGFLLYAIQTVGRPPILLVVPVFLLVVLVPVDGWVPTGSYTIPTGSGTIPTGSSTIPTGSCTLPTGPSKIIATIDGNEVVVTESLIRTQLQLNGVNGLIEFTLHDVLDGMRAIVVPAGGDGATAGAAAAHDVPPPPSPPIVPPTHSSSSTSGPSTVAQATPVREATLVREPTPVSELTPSPVREPTPFREPTPDSLRPPSPPPYPRSEEVGPTTSTRPSSPTRQTSFQEDISEGGGDFVSLLKSNEALQTPATTAVGGAEDSAALTTFSLKLDRCIHRVTSLENELGVTKKVLGGVVLKLVTRVKRLEGLLQQRNRRLVLSDSEGEEAAIKEQDINLDDLYKLASTSLGGDSTVEAAYTIYKASQDAHASSDADHDTAEVPTDTTMPFRCTSTTRWHLRKPFTSSASEHFLESISAVEDTLLAGEGIPAAATTIPAGSSMDTAVQAAAATPSSNIPAANKGKPPMDTDDSLPADLLSEQERLLKNLHDYQLGEDLAKKLHAEQEAEFARQQEELAQKAQAESVASPAEQVAAAVLVPAAPSVTADVSVPAVPPDLAAVSTHVDTEVHAEESTPDDNPIASEQVSDEYTIAASTPSSSRTRRKYLAKKQVTPIVDIADDALIKFDSASDSDDDPLPYAPYAGWEMVPSPLGSIHAMIWRVTPNTSLLFVNFYTWWRRMIFENCWVHVLETVDGRVIYMFVDVSYPLSAATLHRMLKHGLEVPKLLVGEDLAMAEQLVSFIKAALLTA